jgi:rubredoxin
MMNGDLPVGRWQCTACGYIYDEHEGDPYGGLPARTPFAEIPDGWLCPDCGLSQKWSFEPIGRVDTHGSQGPHNRL